MRIFFAILLLCVCAIAQNKPSGFGDTANTNLPAHPIGPNDLLTISVYGAPELSRTARVSAEGEILLPMLKTPIKVSDSMPLQVEASIAERLATEEILVDPVVTVTVAEYTSRPITVAGAVKTPLTFQAMGQVRLLEAISKAGGFTPEAGSEVLVSKSQGGELETRRIIIKDLLSGANTMTNPVLTGGEEIRIPESGRVYVAGNVKKPGAYPLKDAGAITILQVVALAEGLEPYSAKKAYIFRPNTSGARQQIEIPLSEIMRRKKTDVEVQAGDIVYIPDSKTGKLGMAALDRILLFGSTAGATALVYTTR
jgi:polysaccharide biosynthesis/export protein